MTNFFDKVFTRYPVKTRRGLEMLPGLFSWSLILFPLWGAFFFPYFLAYFVLFFDVFFLYRSFSLMATAYIASRRINAAEKENWLEKSKKLSSFGEVNHVVILPNYQESGEKLRRLVKTLADQTFPTKRMFVVLAMEEREKEGPAKANSIIKEFENKFGGIYASYHPDIVG